MSLVSPGHPREALLEVGVVNISDWMLPILSHPTYSFGPVDSLKLPPFANISNSPIGGDSSVSVFTQVSKTCGPGLEDTTKKPGINLWVLWCQAQPFGCNAISCIRRSRHIIDNQWLVQWSNNQTLTGFRALVLFLITLLEVSLSHGHWSPPVEWMNPREGRYPA